MTDTSLVGVDDAGLVPLDHPTAAAPRWGAKAANLATARQAGLRVVDGFVLAPGTASRLAAAAGMEGRLPTKGAGPLATVHAAWTALSRGGSDPVVVRSSSPLEDQASSSAAGVFDSVVDVRGWDAFLDAVAVVVGSAERGRAAPPVRSGDDTPPVRSGDDTPPATGGDETALAVLVQRHVDPDHAGVLFGVDPVTGREDRLVVAAVKGGPQALVSGAVEGERYVLDRRGRRIEGPAGGGDLDRRTLTRLARLSARVARLFGGPQDVEWALTADGGLVLLQSRPVTAASARGEGPVLGPGPVAETFPDALDPLEVDLWLAPLRDALALVVPLTGRASRRALRSSPVLAVVQGRPAVDLDLFEPARRRRGLAALDPRPGLRQVRVAWRVGRLRAALGALAEGIVAELDRDLAAVGDLGDLDDHALVGVLARTRVALRSAHGYELLAGALVAADGPTGSEVALAALAAGRAAHLDDASLIAARPEVLALTAPRIVGPGALPAEPGPPVAASTPGSGPGVDDLGPREALRLRARWLQELSALAARRLGDRLAAQGRLGAGREIALVRFDDLVEAVATGGVPPLDAPTPSSPPLPSRFRLAADGTVVAERSPGSGIGTGAGGGRAAGMVVDTPDGPAARHAVAEGEALVLVVPTLDPRLAPALTRVAAVVSETGSPLSHLAILARERGVATVVGLAGATVRFPPGARVVVDGVSGEVTRLDDAAPTKGIPT